ncbi:hypothetical protein MMU07_07170 [Aquiflexum sp. LQ15W]|uniref:hypothetical protein n=1 Tax=Cognataquiflexum nitidum TaxID=2922272 RepID=UPI001F140C54|nr:hypothetical protein [Cognataquiflexum nitidum]MCH6199351.1 hypothetical protein [Cognataquiflexum nitidum]
MVKMRYTGRLKILLIIIITTLSIDSSNAQSKFSLGIDAGVRNEKPNFTDPQGYLFRDLYPSGTIGLGLAYAQSERWDFEIAAYRTTFNTGVSAFYNEPGFIPFTRYGDMGGGGFATLQIPLRAIYYTGIGFGKFSLHLMGGITTFFQFDNRDWTGSIGSGTPVFPQPAPNIGMEFESRVINRLSLAPELGAEIRYQLSQRFHLAYRFSGILGTRNMVSNEGTYTVSNSPSIVHEFQVIQRGTSLNHFFSMRFRLGKKVI